MDLIRLVVVILMVGILASLGSALFHLARDKGDSKKMVNALTLRVALSIALFLLLMFSWRMGWIAPHGVGR